MERTKKRKIFIPPKCVTYVCDELYYYVDALHVWVKTESDEMVRMGLTDYIQRQLMDIAAIKLPDSKTYVRRLECIGLIESIKAAIEIPAPLSGKIGEINEEVIKEPEIVNRDPYGKGWLLTLQPTNLQEEIKNLLDVKSYIFLLLMGK